MSVFYHITVDFISARSGSFPSDLGRTGDGEVLRTEIVRRFSSLSKPRQRADFVAGAGRDVDDVPRLLLLHVRRATAIPYSTPLRLTSIVRFQSSILRGLCVVEQRSAFG